MSYTINESMNSLYVLHFYEDLSLEKIKKLFADVDKLLTRSGKFGVITIYKATDDHGTDEDFEKDFDGNLDELDDHEHDDDHGHTHKHEPGVARTFKSWIVAKRERFGQDCVGFAMVSADSKFVSFYKPLANKIISRMYNCPGALFGNEEEALAWVKDRMPQPTE